MAKIFKYRGMTIEELNEMSLSELSELLPSDLRRKIKRGFTQEEKKFLSKIQQKDNVKTHMRTMPVLPAMVGKTVMIHNGKEFSRILIQAEMIGHTLGEFAMTRARSKHSSPGVGATKSSSALTVR